MHVPRRMMSLPAQFLEQFLPLCVDVRDDGVAADPFTVGLIGEVMDANRRAADAFDLAPNGAQNPVVVPGARLVEAEAALLDEAHEDHLRGVPAFVLANGDTEVAPTLLIKKI